jgi:predicted DsbA family dithiol-disulfide isomerase
MLTSPCLLFEVVLIKLLNGLFAFFVLRIAQRSFTLPSSVDPGQVSADYAQGVLKIKLAKKAEAKPKQIKVNVGGEKTLEAKVLGKSV